MRLTPVILCVMAFIVALIEIQYSVESWHFFYGILSGRLSNILTTANQFPEVLTVAAVAIAVMIHRPEYRPTIIPLLVAIALSSAVTGVIKEVTGRARPPYGVRITEHEDNFNERQAFVAENPDNILRAANDDYWLITNPPSVYFSANRPWFSGDYAAFPSGHATSAFAFALWLALLFPKGRWLWYLLAILCCLARIRFRRHHPGDVIFGAGVGYLVAYVVYAMPWWTQVVDRGKSVLLQNDGPIQKQG
jgi:membrane-associated phospholipid phosphatase